LAFAFVPPRLDYGATGFRVWRKGDLTQRLSAAEPQPNAGIAGIADIAGI
jgi:hypothetical protein